MFEKAIGIFSVAAIGRASRWLHVRNFVRIRAKHAQERFGSHRAGADFDIVGLLDDSATLSIKSLELEDQLLERWRFGCMCHWILASSGRGARPACLMPSLRDSLIFARLPWA